MQADRQQDGLYAVGVNYGRAGHQQSGAGDQQVWSRNGRFSHFLLKIFTLRNTVMQKTQPADAAKISTENTYTVNLKNLVQMPVIIFNSTANRKS